MPTQIKSDQNIDSGGQERTDNFDEQLLGYNFLRNIWGTYFFDRQGISNEDKVDHINMIVGLMKERIKLMTLHQSSQIEKKLGRTITESRKMQTSHFLQIQLEKTKEALQRSTMKNQQFYQQLSNKQTMILNLQLQNNGLKSQLSQLKQSKNKSEQKIIELSNKIYDLERNPHFNTSYDQNTLDQFSAISMPDSNQKPGNSFFKREVICRQFEQTFHDSIYAQSQQNTDPQQSQQLSEFNINLPANNKNPMKNSLQLYARDNMNQLQANFMQEMKKMKLKSERFLQIQNDKLSQAGNRRKTFQPSTQRPNLLVNITKQRRFRRIR